MKKIASILILAAFSLSAWAQNEPVETTVLGIGTDYFYIPETLKGKVKLVRETNYWAVEKDGQLTKGNQITWKELDSINSTKNFIAYYDEKGAIKQYDHFDENNVIHDSNIGTAENGRYTVWDYKAGPQDSRHFHIKYDNLGYVVAAEHYTTTDSLFRRQALTHDDKGNYTRIEYSDAGGKKQNYQVLTCNDEGKVTNMKVYNGKDSLLYESQNTYGENGRLIRQDAGGSVWEYKYLKFDEKGNWTELAAIIDNGKYKIFAERYFEYY